MHSFSLTGEPRGHLGDLGISEPAAMTTTDLQKRQLPRDAWTLLAEVGVGVRHENVLPTEVLALGINVLGAVVM